MAEQSSPQHNKKHFLHVHAPFLIGFFLLFTVITAFALIPTINAELEQNNQREAGKRLEIESDLLMRFIDYQRSNLQGMADFPVLVNAAMLSSSQSSDLIDLMENFSIDEQKAKLILHDISGATVYETNTAFKISDYSKKPWLKPLINGDIPYYFNLIEQQNNRFTFSLSVPVNYGMSIEGVLTAEITTDLLPIFTTHSDQSDAFILSQGDIKVATDATNIKAPRYYKKDLNQSNLAFTYIIDHAPLIESEQKLRNTILSILLVGLAISFVLFVSLAYRSLGDANKPLSSTTDSLFNRAYSFPFIIAILGLAASIAAYLIFQDVQQQNMKQRVEADARFEVNAIKQVIETNEDILYGLRAFYDASNYVDRKEFKDFVAAILQSNPNIQGLSWIPNVSYKARASFEADAQKDGFENFSFTERTAEGKLITAQKRETYSPVYYLEPFKGNEPALGFDLASNPLRLEALEKARDTGTVVATAKLKLVQGETETTGILLIIPVYKNDPTNQNEEQRQNNHVGYHTMVLKLDALLKGALEEKLSTLDVLVQDVTDAEKSDIIFSSFPDGAPQSHLSSSYSQPIKIGGRTWNVTTWPKTGAYEDSASWAPKLILAGGIAFTALITTMLIQLTRRRMVVESIVIERTQSLAESEEQMREAKHLLELMMENNPDLMFVKDRDFTIVNANPAFLSVYPPEMRDKVIGYTSLENYAEDEMEAFLKHDKIAFKEGYSDTIETITFPDGKVRTLYTQKIRFINSRDEQFILGLGRDITEREQLINKLQESNEELERFAYVASHDLKAPLRAIDNLSQWIEEDIAETISGDTAENMSLMRRRVKRMESLLDDLLSYARITKKVEGAATEFVPLVDIMDDIITLVDAPKGFDIVSSKAMDVIHIPRMPLQQVIYNLVNNAIKHHDKESGTIDISIKDLGSSYRFIIRDDGPGIAPQYHKKIFEMFQTLRPRDEVEGSGMGLALVQKIIRTLGETITVESEVGEGTTFLFTWPKTLENSEV